MALTPSAPTRSSDQRYTFRLGSPADASAISELLTSTWAQSFGLSVPAQDLDMYTQTTLSASQMESDLNDPRYTYILAFTHTHMHDEDTEKEKLIAVSRLVQGPCAPCLTTSPLDTIKLGRLYLDPRYHGSGLAQRLLRITEDKAKQLGAQGIWLAVWEDNARAIRFYHREGYVQRGDQKSYVGTAQRRDWVMEKSLYHARSPKSSD